MSETERSMLDRLNLRYGSYNGNGFRYARAEHVRDQLGFDARRTCDYMALDLYGAGSLHGHEIKVSRSDWLSELADPTKAEAFTRYCDFWWLVVSERSIVKPGELPEGWGLMVASDPSVRVAVAAGQLDPEPLHRGMQGTLSRAITKAAVRLDRSGDPAMGFISRRMMLPLRTEPNKPPAEAVDASSWVILHKGGSEMALPTKRVTIEAASESAAIRAFEQGVGMYCIIVDIYRVPKVDE